MGPGGIPAEVWKSMGGDGLDMLLDMLQHILEQEKMPDDWRECMIVTIIKEKGDIQHYGNYRGIKMMKIWVRINDRRLGKETSICDQQFGSVPEGGKLMSYLQRGR